MSKSREIVYYTEQHTLMYQEVELLVNEKILKEMLSEELFPEVIRELFQTYYLCELKKNLNIKEKVYYGAWNAFIGEIDNIYIYQNSIFDKLKNNLTIEHLNKNVKIVNNLLGLDEKEISESLIIQNKLKDLFKVE